MAKWKNTGGRRFDREPEPFGEPGTWLPAKVLRSSRSPRPANPARQAGHSPAKAETGNVGSSSRGRAATTSWFRNAPATRLHYDVGCIDGTMKSWAECPRTFPEPRDQALAGFKRKDHPLDYATSKGKFPKGAIWSGNGTGLDAGIFHVEAISTRLRQIGKGRKTSSSSLNGEKVRGSGSFVMV